MPPEYSTKQRVRDQQRPLRHKRVIDLGLIEDVFAVVGSVLLDDVQHMAIVVDGIALSCSSTRTGGAVTLVSWDDGCGGALCFSDLLCNANKNVILVITTILLSQKYYYHQYRRHHQ
jgi:hypothetical protein